MEPVLKPIEGSRACRLRELAWVFLKLGTVGFGGPAAHISMMEDEVVRRREWLRRDEFLDLVGATNLIPGPNSTELAISIGRLRAGVPGLLLAGACFILPAAVIVTFCGWFYRRFGELPQAEGILHGVKPVIIAVVAQAIWGLSRSALKSNGLIVLALGASGLSLSGVHELWLLFGGGLVAALARRFATKQSSTMPIFGLAAPDVQAEAALPMVMSSAGWSAAITAATASATPFGLWPMFWFFVKVGSVLYGSGYVLLAFLRADLVDRWHWLSENQLLDAVIVGQMTPGPVFTTATFIGYQLAGVPGAALSTLGIFLPAFCFVGLSGPLVPLLRKSPIAGAFLDGLNVVSLALMFSVTWQLGRVALVDPLSLGMVLGSAILLMRFRVASTWLMLGGAAIGLWRSQ